MFFGVFFLLFYAEIVRCVYFYLPVDSRKCFYEPLIIGKNLIGRIEHVEDSERYLNYKIEVSIIELFNSELVVYQDYLGIDDEFYFTSLNDGEYEVCFKLEMKGQVPKPLENIQIPLEIVFSYEYTDSMKDSFLDIDSIETFKKKLHNIYNLIYEIQKEQRSYIQKYKNESAVTNNIWNKVSFLFILQCTFTCFIFYVHFAALKGYLSKRQMNSEKYK